jgi:hypothetical protein
MRGQFVEILLVAGNCIGLDPFMIRGAVEELALEISRCTL